MQPDAKTERPPVCDYEGSDYQERFWEKGDRVYEDQVEAIAIKRLMPESGRLLLEVGAGAGRNTARYHGFERIVLMDFSVSQLEQAQQRLGAKKNHIYVAADVYKLPFVDGLFDAATMIRVIHHMVDAPRALTQLNQVLQPNAKFLLEFANKRHFKAILRYWSGKQKWDPFDRTPVEYIPLNFDFHPREMRSWLQDLGFRIERQLTVSHFRIGWMKRNLPLVLLVGLDALFQPTGALWQFTPSVFLRARAAVNNPIAATGAFFKCPECGTALPEFEYESVVCSRCGRRWGKANGIYNFKQPLES